MAVLASMNGRDHGGTGAATADGQTGPKGSKKSNHMLFNSRH